MQRQFALLAVTTPAAAAYTAYFAAPVAPLRAVAAPQMSLIDSITNVLKEAEQSPEDEPPSSSVVDDKPLSAPARVARALKFWSQVVPILGAYKAAELSDAPESKYQELHEWGSERLENAIMDLKGFYVKTGQVISTRVDLFPEQYTTRLASLQDDLDAMPVEIVKAVVEQELLQGESLDSIFASFDDEPLGAASIAQVCDTEEEGATHTTTTTTTIPLPLPLWLTLTHTHTPAACLRVRACM